MASKVPWLSKYKREVRMDGRTTYGSFAGLSVRDSWKSYGRGGVDSGGVAVGNVKDLESCLARNVS
jgi:hypothetical protein